MLHRSRCAGSILLLAGLAAVARADTRQSFDGAARGTAYAHTDARTDQAVQPLIATETVDFTSPTSCNAIGLRRFEEGTREFVRLSHDEPPVEPKANCNTITFNCVEARTTGRVGIDFDFRVRNRVGAEPADGFSISLLRVAADLVPGAAINIDEDLRPAVAERPDMAGSLGFGFRFYTGGDESVENVKVFWSGSVVQSPFPLAAGQSMVNVGWIHASIRVDFGLSRVSVRLTREDQTVLLQVDDLAVPGLAPYASRVHLAARSTTGGLTADVDIDELTVAFPPGDPALVGSWSSPILLSSVPIHAALLPGGKVLYWDRHDYADGRPFLWDGTASVAPEDLPMIPGTEEMYDLFCAGHTFMADGSLFVAGGHIADNYGEPWVSRFDPRTEAWSELEPMQAGRWYPTTTTLPNGDIVAAAGDISPFAGTNRFPEVYDARTKQWRTLTGAERPLPFYPFLFTTPQGLFAAGSMVDTAFLDVTPPGRWLPVAETNASGRDYGSAVLTDAEKGRILLIGGTQAVGPTLDTLRSTERIDLSQEEPVWVSGPSMTFARRMHVGTLLPDGEVLVTGGTAGDTFNRADGAILNPELLNAAGTQWQPMSCSEQARVYHSIALLLPDARVLVAGGGHPAETESCDSPPCIALDHPNAEIFSPPYLFRGPQLEAPAIAAGPGVVLGEDGAARVRSGAVISYAVSEPSRVASVVWMRPAAVTHAFNQDQRLVRLKAGPGGIGAEVVAPADPSVAPPGPYMMFLVDDKGVPSHAAWVRTNLAPEAADDAFEVDQDDSIPDILARVVENDQDIERDPVQVTIVDPPKLGQLTGGEYVPPATGVSGEDSFSYTLSDGLDQSEKALVTIRVHPAGGEVPIGGGDGDGEGGDDGCGCRTGGSAPLGSLLVLLAAASILVRRRRAR
jgi:MYXO-CTERM domain-containing protein